MGVAARRVVRSPCSFIRDEPKKKKRSAVASGETKDCRPLASRLSTTTTRPQRNGDREMEN